MGVYYDTALTHTVVGAWGLRKMVSGYSGALIRIRDSVGNAEQDVGADGNGNLASFTVSGTPYVTTIYDQSGNGSHLVQATSSLQPALVLNATPGSRPVVKFDGVDDFMRDTKAAATSSSSLAYLVSNPIVFYIAGNSSPREAFCSYWKIPQADGANTTPYGRIALEGPTGTGDDDIFTIKVNGTDAANTFLSTFRNGSGWGGTVIVPNLGQTVRAALPSIVNSGYGSGVTYPSNTRLYLNGNGLGAENTAQSFVELAIVSGTPANTTTIQAVLEQAEHDAMFGDNNFYKLITTDSFNSDTNAGFAELEVASSASGTDMIGSGFRVGAGARFNSGETWDNAVDNNTATYWASGSGTANQPFVFYTTSGLQIVELRMRLRNDSSHALSTAKYTLYRMTPTGWEAATAVDNKSAGSSAGKLFTNTIAFAFPPISGSWSFDYAIHYSISGSWSFDYEIDEPLYLLGSWSFDYGIAGPVVGDWSFDYDILLGGSWGFSYNILVDFGDVLGYRHVAGSTIPRAKFAPTLDRSASVIGSAEIFDHSGPGYPSSVVLDPDKVVNDLHFYQDFYNRVWTSPIDYRLSNPKIGFPYAFRIWNAFDRPNQMLDYTPTDLGGVEFVEAYDLPLTFLDYEQIELHFIIGPTAPATIQGRYDFDFEQGHGFFNLFALVLGVLKTLPNEPMREVWSWYTSLEVSINGTEQRQAIRYQPRTQVSYDVIVEDEEDRISVYQQFYSFASRSVLVPMFQYTTPLNDFGLEGDTRIYFNIERSDIRVDEYLVLYNKFTDQFAPVQVLILQTDGVTLTAPLAFDVDPDFWEVLPGRSMRLPNQSALAVGALNGTATFSGESTVWRDVVRPGSSASLTMGFGYPILIDRPVAQDDIDETFETDVTVIDNDSAEPVQVSNFTNPFVSSAKSYLIDRDTDMDYWRAFFDYCKGQLRPFLLPTWRDDLPLYQEPNLGDAELLTTNTDFLDYFAHAAYGYVQIMSDAGVIYRRVLSANIDSGNVRITLNDNIGNTVGSNTGLMVSFLNLTRLNSDEVEMEHYVNYTLVNLEFRTVNQ